MELAYSERDYSSQLWSLLHTYMTPLQTAGFLSVRELDTLFPLYLEQMYTDHCHICTGLQDRLIHWTYAATVADLLDRFTDSYSSVSTNIHLLMSAQNRRIKMVHKNRRIKIVCRNHLCRRYEEEQKV